MPNIHYQLARCYQQIGNTLAAEKTMQQFHALKSADTEIQKHIEAVFVADADEKADAVRLKIAIISLLFIVSSSS